MQNSKCIIIFSLVISFLCISINTISEQKASMPKKAKQVVVISYNSPSYYIPAKYKDWVEFWCTYYGYPIWLFARMIEQESSWKAKARCYHYKNKKLVSIDRGIAQWNTKYDSEWRLYWDNPKQYDPDEPYSALKASIKRLSKLRKQGYSLVDSIAIYNCGEARYLAFFENGTPLSSITVNHLNIIFMNVDVVVLNYYEHCFLPKNI